jgi:HEAT repeat protein
MRKGASRFARTVRSLVAISLLGAGLAAYNAYALRRDTSLATGPRSEAQHQFFLSAADRPDIDLFYKGLTHGQRITMAERIGGYDDPELAALIGDLLGTFDAPARDVLSTALTAIARKHPGAAAEQLKQSGSLQLLAIANALRAAGNSDLPAVAAQLDVKDARPNAAAFLVSAGPAAVPAVMPYLDDADKDVRMAATDTLGKIGSRAPVPVLVTKYRATTGDERFAYLSAIAAIGAPETEGLLSKSASDLNLSTPRRAQAMLGLGRIGSSTAICKLWSFANDDDAQIRQAMISALQLAGNRGLKVATRPDIGLKIANGVRTPEADAYIARMLSDPATIAPAAEVAGNRSQLAPALLASLHRTQDGAAIDAVMRALSTTAEGLSSLKGLERDPILGGFAMRRLRLARG